MKKVLSVLLTICLFATLVVSAFAYGVPTDVAKVEFDKAEYKLEDVIGMDLTALMTAYDAYGNRTNFEDWGYTSLQIEEWYSSYENVLSVDGDELVVIRPTAGASDLRVTLTAKTTTEKKATTTIIVPKDAVAAPGNPNAYGFSTKNATLATDGAAAAYDGIVPVLKDYPFTAEQAAGFSYAVKVPGTSYWAPVGTEEEPLVICGISFWAEDVDGFMTLKYAYTPAMANTVEIGEKYADPLVAGESIRVRVLGTAGFASNQKDKEFALTLANPAGPAAAPVFNVPVSINLNVGEVIDLRTLNSSLKDVNVDWAVLPYGSYQTMKEAGQIAKLLLTNDTCYELKGLAEGVVNVMLTVEGFDMTKMIKVNVGDGVANTPKMTASASVKVGETVALSIKELAAGVTVNWSADNENVTLDATTGASVNVTGAAAGTAVVTAKIYNAEKDGTLLYTLETTVTVAAADPAVDATAPSANPQTGDSLFANLF